MTFYRLRLQAWIYFYTKNLSDTSKHGKMKFKTLLVSEAGFNMFYSFITRKPQLPVVQCYWSEQFNKDDTQIGWDYMNHYCKTVFTFTCWNLQDFINQVKLIYRQTESKLLTA